MAIGVEVNGDLEKALSRLKKKLKESDQWLEWKDAQHYTKPSKERRDEKHRAIQREKARAKEEFKWDPNSKYYYKNQRD